MYVENNGQDANFKPKVSGQVSRKTQSMCMHSSCCAELSWQDAYVLVLATAYVLDKIIPHYHAPDIAERCLLTTTQTSLVRLCRLVRYCACVNIKSDLASQLVILGIEKLLRLMPDKSRGSLY